MPVFQRYRVKHNRKEHIPLTITTTSTAEQIKEAAEAKDKSLYYKIKALNLIVEEFKDHVSCKNGKTKSVSRPSRLRKHEMLFQSHD